mmetsp:Transcript_17718/g.71116  ORF Transcript_17718/g.71116 Transcript_17718/m.71116 type:complete len:231 (+) Transcript_17718:372-1064(+)
MAAMVAPRGRQHGARRARAPPQLRALRPAARDADRLGVPRRVGLARPALDVPAVGVPAVVGRVSRHLSGAHRGPAARGAPLERRRVGRVHDGAATPRADVHPHARRHRRLDGRPRVVRRRARTQGDGRPRHAPPLALRAGRHDGLPRRRRRPRLRPDEPRRPLDGVPPLRRRPWHRRPLMFVLLVRGVALSSPPPCGGLVLSLYPSILRHKIRPLDQHHNHTPPCGRFLT